MGLKTVFQDGNPANEEAGESSYGLSYSPAISGELAAEIPLSGPSGAESGGGFVVLAVVAACKFDNLIEPADVQYRVACNGVREINRLSKRKFHTDLPARQEERTRTVCFKGILREIVFIRPGHAFEGFGTVGGTLEIAVFLKEGAEPQGD